MEEKLLTFLEALEDVIEPPDGRHHNITAIDGRLVLFVSTGELWQSFYLEAGDLDKPAKALVAEIEALLPPEFVSR